MAKVRAGRKKSHATGCIYKHGTLGEGHIEEVMAKLARECRGDKCKVPSLETRQETHEAVKNLMLLEEHIQSEILPRTKGREAQKRLKTILDETRRARQKISNSRLDKRNKRVQIEGDPVEIMSEAKEDMEMIMSMIEDPSLVDLMSQEQFDCDRCVEDARWEGFGQGVKIEQTKTKKKKTKKKKVKRKTVRIHGHKITKKKKKVKKARYQGKEYNINNLPKDLTYDQSTKRIRKKKKPGKKKPGRPKTKKRKTKKRSKKNGRSKKSRRKSRK